MTGKRHPQKPAMYSVWPLKIVVVREWSVSEYGGFSWPHIPHLPSLRLSLLQITQAPLLALIVKRYTYIVE